MDSTPPASPSEQQLQQARRHHQAGRLKSAERLYRQVLAADANNAKALHLLGVLAHQRGEPDTAIDLITRAIAIDAGRAAFHTHLGVACRARGDLDESVAAHRRAIALSPQDVAAHINLGLALRDLGDRDGAGASFKIACELDPRNADALNHLGTVLLDTGEVEQAMGSFEAAVAHQPDFAGGWSNLGLARRTAGHLEEAIEALERSLALAPELAGAHTALATCLLLLGRFEQGWKHYDWRLQNPERTAVDPVLAGPPWDGASAQGKRLLLIAEQGLGDTIQFIRYARVLREQGAEVVAALPRSLCRLLKSVEGIDEVCPLAEEVRRCDAHAHLLSLPRLCGTDASNIPAPRRYLQAEAEFVERWSRRLPGHGERKVGLAWQGRRSYFGDRWRSIPLACLAPLLDVPGASFVSLQKGDGSEQIETAGLSKRITCFGDDLDGGEDAFVDTAAVIENLDLVITSDTAVAHLAAALGKETWILLPHVPDWRWMLGREDSPWYPTMRLFRQAHRGEWGPVIRRVLSALAELGRRRGG